MGGCAKEDKSDCGAGLFQPTAAENQSSESFINQNSNVGTDLPFKKDVLNGNNQLANTGK